MSRKKYDETFKKQVIQEYNAGGISCYALGKKYGVDATLINPRYITGVDEKLLEDLKKSHKVVVTLEDGVLDGGFGEKIARFYGNSDVKVLNFGLKKEFLDRYNIYEVLKANHLTPGQIAKDVIDLLK